MSGFVGITKAVERDISPSEREFLLRVLESSPTGTRRWMRAAGNALVAWAGICLVLFLAWSLIGWLARLVTHRDFGWHSDIAILLLPVIGLIATAVSIVSTVSWLRSWQDTRPLMQADLQAGRVVEEECVFTEALRFQEPEHGGLIYFLRTADDRVLTLYDYESQNLGAQGGDPLASGFRPTTNLVIVRAPRTRWVLDKRFSGDPLECGQPFPLSVSPRLWPESEEYCEIPWEALRVRLGER